MITKVLLKVLDDCYESLSLALRFCLEDVAKDMFSKGLISESTMISPNYDTVISEFKTGMKEKEDTPQLEKYCRLFLTCLSCQGGPAEAGAEDLAEQWKEEVQRELNISLSLDVVITDQDMKQMESELVEANTEMTEHITTNETEHLEGLNIRDHFNELLRQFKHELHGKLSKGEEKLSNITDFVQQLVSTEDLCDVKDLDEVLKKLDGYYNFLDFQIIILFAKRFATPALLQKFENHSKEAKSFRRSHTIKILQNSFDVNFDSHQSNASISLNIAWSNVIIDRLYMLIEQFSVKHGSHFVLKHIKVTESSVHIEYFMRNSSMEIQENIAHAQERVPFMCFIGIYEFTINEHVILQVDNEENFTFELALLNAARTGHNEAVQFLLDLTDNTDHCNEEALVLASEGGYEPVVKSLLLAALMLASEGGYEAVVKSLLLAGANVNSRNYDGWTALMKASKNNHITIIHTLLEVGADPHLQISDGHNALMIASFSGHHQVVEQLLSKNVDCNYQPKNGINALMYASLNGHSNVVELLLNARADPNIQDSNGCTALMTACSEGHFKVVELLLDTKANPNIQHSDGCTALMLASHHGYSEIVELLLKEVANPNIQDSNTKTALMIACLKGHFKVVELLLNKNADPNIQDSGRVTTLMIASSKGHIKVIELLLNKNADPNIQDSNGYTALMTACSEGHFKVVELLLDRKANPNIQHSDGCTALMLASHHGYSEIVELLLKDEADPNIQNRDRYTALRFANQNGHFRAVELLLKHHANPNIQGKKAGYTELHFAVLSLKKDAKSGLLFTAMPGTVEDYIKIIQLLTGQSSTDIDAVADKGFTSLMFASMNGCTEVVELLLEAGANPNIQIKTSRTMRNIMSDLPDDKLLRPQFKSLLSLNVSVWKEMSYNGTTALMSASMEGHLDIVQILLQAKAKLDIQNECGFTALLLAAMKGYSEIVQHLLESGANPNISSRDGRTPLYAAVYDLSLQHTKKFKNDSIISVDCEMDVPAGTYEDYITIIQLLVAQPNIDIVAVNTSVSGYTSLQIASMYGCIDAVKLLLQVSADPNIQAHRVETSNKLSYLPSNILLQPQVKLFLLQSNFQTDLGWTALMFASVKGHTEIVQLLLNAKAKPDIQMENGETALYLAIMRGYSDIVQLLLEYGADPNTSTRHGVTAIHVAAAHASITLAIGEDITATEVGNTLAILTSGTYEHHFKIMKLLVAQPNIKINETTPSGLTILMVASAFGNAQTVELLLQAGADPNMSIKTPADTFSLAKTKTLLINELIGCTALILACANGHLEVVQLLLKANANPNHEQEGTGITALIIAAGQGYPDIVQQLLEYSADPNSISDIDGSTALHCVLSHPETLHKDDKEKKLNIIQQLIEKGANINIQNEDGVTALMMACNEVLSEVVELLLQNGADPNIHGDKGWTALMYACSHGNSKVAKSLLRYNANPQLVDNDGFTASIHALCSGNKVLAYEVVNDRDFSQNELKCLLIMDLLEGDQTEAISRLDDITDLTTDKKELLISCVVGSLEDVIGKLHESCLHPVTPLVGGLTLLMIASSCGYIELVEYLVIMEADVNQRDIFWKYTPLFYAILGNKSNEIVELLLENGADINAVARNQTPLDVANSSPVKNLISSLLLKNGGQTFSELTSEKSGIQPNFQIKLNR